MTSKERIQRLNALKLEVKRLKGEIRNVEREKNVINQEFYEEAPFKIGDKVLYTKDSRRIKKGEEKELVYIVTGWNFNLPYDNRNEEYWDDYLYKVDGQPEYTFYLAKMKKDGTPSEFNGDKVGYVNPNTLKKVDLARDDIAKDLFITYNNCGRCNGCNTEGENVKCKYFQKDWIGSGGANMVCPHWEPK